MDEKLAEATLRIKKLERTLMQIMDLTSWDKTNRHKLTYDTATARALAQAEVMDLIRWQQKNLWFKDTLEEACNQITKG